MLDRNQAIDALGGMMYQAARASVAKGAVYEPGDNVSTDAAAAWRGIAEAIVGFVEQRIVEAREIGREQGT